MFRSLAAPSVAGRWITIGLAVMACARAPKNVTDTTKAATAAADTATVYDEEWNTPLPLGVSSDPEAFRARIAALRLPGSRGPQKIRRRAGKLCSGCSVDVAIQAIAATRNIDPDSLWPNPPRAVALLQNQDKSRKEAYYGLKPKADANYYLWVDSANRKTRLTILEVPNGSGKVRGGRQKFLTVCHHYSHKDSYGSDYGDADFVENRPEGNCEGYAAAVKTATMTPLFSVSMITRILMRPLQVTTWTLERSGGWIDCNSGCCW